MSYSPDVAFNALVLAAAHAAPLDVITRPLSPRPPHSPLSSYSSDSDLDSNFERLAAILPPTDSAGVPLMALDGSPRFYPAGPPPSPLPDYQPSPITPDHPLLQTPSAEGISYIHTSPTCCTPTSDDRPFLPPISADSEYQHALQILNPPFDYLRQMAQNLSAMQAWSTTTRDSQVRAAELYESQPIIDMMVDALYTENGELDLMIATLETIKRRNALSADYLQRRTPSGWNVTFNTSGINPWTGRPWD